MPAPISNDLRQRIVDEYQNGKSTLQQLAARFCVGDASAQRFNALFSRTGSVEPVQGYKRGPKPLLNEASLALVRQLSEEFPDYFDHEIAELLCERSGLSVSARTINRAFHLLKITRKKNVSSQPAKTGGSEGKKRGVQRVANEAKSATGEGAGEAKRGTKKR